MSAASAGQAQPLSEVYALELRLRGFQADPAQLAVIARLDLLQRELLASRAPSALRLALQRYFPRRLALRQPRGLYIWGSVGRGKSYLMDLFFANLPLAAKQRSHFHRFMRAVHDGLHAAGERERPLDAVAAQIAGRARVICFDELFVADIADAMLLHGLFAELFRRGVCFVITSNLPPAQLYRGGLQRERFLPAIALLEKHLDVLHLDGGADYRLRQLERADIYLASTEPGSTARLTQMFEALAAGADARPGVLQIEGRAIPARRSGNGIAWFDFAALCEGPRSANDYVELARQLHTVLVADVPVFQPRDEDAARRFIALVDELYDHDVKLVVSAAAPPAQLYRGKLLSFEFQRTASRLIEMQSHDYLARAHRP
jgi:cell division protein ZapE